jgi:hypothetical protein
MLKEDAISFIVYILMIAVAAIVGFAIINPAFRSVTSINGWNVAVYLLVCLLISIILEVILFEVAHVIGAKIGKYTILSVNVVGFCFYKVYSAEKKKNVFKFKFPKNFDGLTGETLISPESEKSNPIPFVLSPLILFAIEVAILVVAYVFITKPKTGQNPLDFLKYFQLILVTIGGMLFIYDYTPAKLDTMTDGYRLVLLNKKINVEAYNVLLKIQSDEFMKKEVTSYKTFNEITDFTARVNLASVRNYLKTDNYQEAMKLVDQIVNTESKVSFETRVIAKVYKLNMTILYISVDEAKKVYDSFNEKDLFYLKSEYTMLTIRTAILYYGLAEKSNSECENQLHKVKKALDKEMVSSKDYEEKLLKKTVAFVKEKNKDLEVTY